MKTGIKVALVFISGFLSGGALGYFFCKSQETKFEICTDEEQVASAEADEQTKNSGKTVEERINEAFAKDGQKNETTEPKAVQAINTQKTEYWKKYQEEGGKYDRHDELEEGEDPVTSDEQFDQGFMQEITNDESEETEAEEDIPDVEDSSLQEFYHWSGIPDGEYDTISVGWFSGDDVLVDDDNTPIKNPLQFLGFDPKTEFEGRKAPDEDPDALYKKNNHYKTIFEVIRYNATYSVKKRMEEFGGDD